MLLPVVHSAVHMAVQVLPMRACPWPRLCRRMAGTHTLHHWLVHAESSCCCWPL